MINKSKQQNFRLFFLHPHASQIPQPVSLAKICLFWKKSCILGLRRKNKKSKLKKHQTNPKKTKKECLIQKEKEKIETKCLMQGACVSCRQCIGCERSKVRNCGRSLCFDARGVVNCGYFGLCSGSKVDVVACKLYIRK